MGDANQVLRWTAAWVGAALLAVGFGGLSTVHLFIVAAATEWLVLVAGLRIVETAKVPTAVEFVEEGRGWSLRLRREAQDLLQSDTTRMLVLVSIVPVLLFMLALASMAQGSWSVLVLVGMVLAHVQLFLHWSVRPLQIARIDTEPPRLTLRDAGLTVPLGDLTRVRRSDGDLEVDFASGGTVRVGLRGAAPDAVDQVAAQLTTVASVYGGARPDGAAARHEMLARLEPWVPGRGPF